MADIAAAPARTTSSLYPTYVLSVMTAVYFSSFLDRQVMAILLPQIQAEFRLTDTQLGMLVGPAFGLFYTFLAIPLAFIADRSSRRNLIGVCVLLFSAATFFSAYISAFALLLISRLAVGAGQAGTTPAANSILSDVIPRHKRAAAMAIGSVGGKAGMITALFAGGLIAAEYGWRTALWVAGMPGLVLTVLIFLTIKEPARGVMDNRKDTGKAPSIFATLKILLSRPTYRNICFGGCFTILVTATMMMMTAAFIQRSHPALNLREVAFISTGFGILGAIGTYFTGVVADRLAVKNIRWLLYAPALVQLIAAPFLPFFLLASNVPLMILFGFVPIMIGGAAFTGPVFAALQNVSPLRTRSVATGIFVFISGVFGSIIGPWAVGYVSDLLKPVVQQDSLRWSLLLIMTPLMIGGAFFFWRGSRTLEADIARASAHD